MDIEKACEATWEHHKRASGFFQQDWKDANRETKNIWRESLQAAAPFLQIDTGRVYPHLPICSGDSNFPAGEPGHGCCCLNRTYWELQPDLIRAMFAALWGEQEPTAISKSDRQGMQRVAHLVFERALGELTKEETKAWTKYSSGAPYVIQRFLTSRADRLKKEAGGDGTSSDVPRSIDDLHVFFAGGVMAAAKRAFENPDSREQGSTEKERFESAVRVILLYALRPVSKKEKEFCKAWPGWMSVIVDQFLVHRMNEIAPPPKPKLENVVTVRMETINPPQIVFRVMLNNYTIEFESESQKAAEIYAAGLRVWLADLKNAEQLREKV